MVERANFLASDRPVIAFAVRELVPQHWRRQPSATQRPTCPVLAGTTARRHPLRVTSSAERALRLHGQRLGKMRPDPASPPAEEESCEDAMTVRTWSTTQETVALSSAEAQLSALVQGSVRRI